MKHMEEAMRLTRRDILAALSLFAGAGGAVAQAWPSRVVTIVVPFAAGGPTDLVARVLAERLRGVLGQPVIVENRAGGGGDVGGQHVARAAPDGHTLLLSTTGSIAINRHLTPNPAYDPLRDFLPISLTFKSDHVVIVNPRVQATSLAELIALLRAQPQGFSYGSAGVGATSHMIAEYFKARAGVSMEHVPYRGAGPALADLVAGHVHVMVDSLANAMTQIRAGTVRALAVTGRERHPQLPDVPTALEAGVPDFVAFAWGALLAPLGTPAAIIERLSEAVRGIYADAEVRERLATAGADAIASRPDELAAFMAEDTARWEGILRNTGLAGRPPG
jgi:tripartite-type tricarboxylate transporter receptor subunit TctC